MAISGDKVVNRIKSGDKVVQWLKSGVEGVKWLWSGDQGGEEVVIKWLQSDESFQVAIIKWG